MWVKLSYGDKAQGEMLSVFEQLEGFQLEIEVKFVACGPKKISEWIKEGCSTREWVHYDGGMEATYVLIFICPLIYLRGFTLLSGVFSLQC